MISFDDTSKESDKSIVKCLVCRSIRFWIEGLVMQKLKSEMSSLQKDKGLDRGISYEEIKKCSKSLKNNKTGGNDGLVGELFKYGGKGMANLLKVLYGVVWTEESIPKQWRQGLIVSLYKN